MKHSTQNTNTKGEQKMAKATHSGTCQLCGRGQKLPNGVLSKHGYTVDWGFFSGTCRGSAGRPFEESTDLIEKMIKRCEAQIVRLGEDVKEMRAYKGNMAYRSNYYSHGERGYGRSSGYALEYVEIKELVRTMEDGYVLKTYSSDRLIAPEKQHPSSKDLSTPFECKDLPAVIKDLNEKYIKRTLEGEINKIQRYITWQKERVANWKPGKLTPVK
jgi:hypothetical protein